jgi:transcriptional regulator with XRE-family HTH domain
MSTQDKLDPDTIGARIRMYREAAGMSLSELARSSGVSKSYLWNLENRPEHQQPSGTTLYELAKALGTTMSVLLGRKLLVEQPEPTKIDPVLAKFAKAEKLNEAEIATLASIQWRGEPPKTMDRWKYVHQALKTSRSLDD